MAKQSRYKRRCRAFISKKAFVFSLDMAIAVLITVLLMTAAHRHMANAEANKVSNIQMISVGSDIAALLDYSGVLQTLNEKQIESEMNDLMPQNYKMLLKLIVDDGTVLYAGDSVPGEQFVGTGKRFFAIKDSDSIKNYAYVTYWVWTR